MWRRQTLFLMLVLGLVLSWLGYFVNTNYYLIVMVTRAWRLFPGRHVEAGIVDEFMRALPRSDDPRSPHSRYVVLAVPPKMGTTWIGHIAHQLLRRGMEVNTTYHLCVEFPYVEQAHFHFGHKLVKHDPPYWTWFGGEPIVMRTHVAHSYLKSINVTADHGFRMVTVLRDPADTLLSRHRYLPALLGINPRDIPVESFATTFSEGFNVMMDEYAQAWERRHHPNALIIFYDDMKEELNVSVERLARHMAFDPPLNKSVLEKVTSQATREFMSSPEVVKRFNEPRGAEAQVMGLTKKDMYIEQTGLVRKGGGKSGEGAHALPKRVLALLDELWATRVFPSTGCVSYQDMLQKMRAMRSA